MALTQRGVSYRFVSLFDARRPRGGHWLDCYNNILILISSCVYMMALYKHAHVRIVMKMAAACPFTSPPRV